MPDNYKSLLIRAKEEVSSGFIEFLQSDVRSDTVVAFVEGVDDQEFYFGFLSSLSEQADILFIRCHTKSGVERAANDLRRRGLKKNCACTLFLSDRDFSEFCSADLDPDVFYTQFYSIESYLMDACFFDHILGAHCGITRRRERSQITEKLVGMVQASANNLVGLFAAMCLERKHVANADLDKLPLVHFIAANYETEEYCLRTEIGAVLDELVVPAEVRGDLEKLIESMQAKDFRVWVRGRHLWQLIRKVAEVFCRETVPRSFGDMFSRHGLRVCYQALKHLEELAQYVARRCQIADYNCEAQVRT